MERNWASRAANDETINVEIRVEYTGDNVRPDRFIVIQTIDGVRQPPEVFRNQAGG